jgi:hypothetical protein
VLARRASLEGRRPGISGPFILRGSALCASHLRMTGRERNCFNTKCRA